ncbi:DUF4180 domain-containing protein [Vallitalea pronyensis]|uniref:DUF4180 domain-containing protein n=2 Tax=Vallitalea pronyensis TaxID=1348613 RepID=A0A8J8MQ65_9FIRM|nr:DUF4180 domain-containing protein [Vallitalea pronyensis]
MTINKKNNVKVAIIDRGESNLHTVQDALDMMSNAQCVDCMNMLIHKDNIHEKFFDLKTKFAGEVLQKFINYQMRLAIIGDFSHYTSKSLKDFIYECNKGQWIFFKATVEEGLNALHSVALKTF